MSLTFEQVDAALGALRALLSADGYDLQTVEASRAGIILQIAAGEGACAECLVPASMMSLYVRDALKGLPASAGIPIELRYPPPHDHGG